MKEALYKIAQDKPVFFDNAQRQKVYDYIKRNQHLGKEARVEHKQNVVAYKEALKEMEKQKMCPYCKTSLVLRNGRNGPFYGCKNYPKCKYTINCE